jgi:hypothetical protein
MEDNEQYSTVRVMMYSMRSTWESTTNGTVHSCQYRDTEVLAGS